MVQILPDFDEVALRHVRRIERALTEVDPDYPGPFMAITNALQYHLEISPRDARTVRLLAQALEAYVRSRGIDPRATGVGEPLNRLMAYSGADS